MANILGDLSGLLVSLAAAYSLALLAGMIELGIPRKARLVGASGIALLLCPLSISPDQIVLRAAGEILCMDLFLKVADYGRQCRISLQGRSVPEYVRLLVPFPLFQAVVQDRRHLSEKDHSLANVARIVLGGMAVAGGYGLVLLLNRLPAVQTSFALDHVLKAAVFIFTVEAGSRFLYGIERLMGYETTPLVRNVFLSLSVAEFWLRWNNRVHRWLKANAFQPVMRRFGRVGGVVAVFALSGLIHEIGFDVATGHWDGYQLLFFLLQIPMVLLSDYVAPALRRRNSLVMVPMYMSTVCWMMVTSTLFLRGVDRVFPFVYASDPWLP